MQDILSKDMEKSRKHLYDIQAGKIVGLYVILGNNDFYTNEY